MPTYKVRQLQRRAHKLGISWSDVCDAYHELRASQREGCEHENALRQRAWEKMVTPGSHPFWRHGFYVRWPRAFAEGDRTLIPGFDVVADGLSYEFPELRGENDPAATLYDILCKPYVRMPDRDKTWQQAFDQVAALAVASKRDAAVSFNFGANRRRKPR